jgi:hypothetical protein
MYQEYAAQELADTERKVIAARATRTYWRSEAARLAETTERRTSRRMSLQGKGRLAIAAAIAKLWVFPRIESYGPQDRRTAPR